MSSLKGRVEAEELTVKKTDEKPQNETVTESEVVAAVRRLLDALDE